MKKILVPTDFSPNAMKAATYAAEIARRTGALLYILHIIEPVIDKIRRPYPLQERLQDDIVNARSEELRIFKDAVSKIYADISIITVLANGTIATEILNFADENEIDIIAMGTSGASGVKEVLVGSVTGSTISRTKVPVLAVPLDYSIEEPDAIIFATNRFEENRVMLDKIVGLAKLFNATIHTTVFVDADTSRADSLVYNQRQLNNYLNFLKRTYPEISFTGELLEGHEFEETVEDYNNKHGVDIIALITYPKNFWEKLMKKSTTKKMAFHSKIPLLAIPANMV